MICPSCNQEMEKATVRYHTPSGYERKLVVFECQYDCSGQDFTEDEARIAALESRLREAEAMFTSALDDNYWHEEWCAAGNGDECTCWVGKARAFLAGGEK